jgi:hypothetical protein
VHRDRKKSLTESTIVLSSQTEPLLIDVPTAANRISSTKAVIRRLIRTGQLPVVAWGKKHLVSPEDLRTLIAANKKVAA